MKKIPMIMLMAAVAAALMCNTAMAEGRMGVIKNGTFFYDTETKWNQGATNAGNSGNLIGFLHWLPSGYQNNPKNDEDKDGEADILREMEKPNNTAEVKTTEKKNIPEGRSIEDPTLLYGVDGDPVRWVKLELKHNKTYGAGYRLRYIPFEGIYGDGFNPDAPASWRDVDGLQFDLSGLASGKYYYLEADVYIDKHTLEDSGWYAGSEWPVAIEMGYADANNSGKNHYWGFLDGVDTQGQRPYTQIESKTWYHYRSVELRSLYDTGGETQVDPIDRIYSVRVACYGWDAEVRIANVDIYEYDSEQTSSLDDQVYPLVFDNFESYPLNTWPSPNWVRDANANNDPSNNRVVVDPTDDENKVLKLYGALTGCWGALAYHQSSFPNEFFIEAKVYNGSEILTGCHPDRAAIAMRNGTSWGNYARYLIKFMGNGDILANDGTILQSYQTEQWYDVKIHYELLGQNLTLQYWIDGTDLGQIQITIDNLSAELSLDHIDLTSQEGSAYFDDIMVGSTNN